MNIPFLEFWGVSFGALLAFCLQYFHEKNTGRTRCADRILKVQNSLAFQYDDLTAFSDLIKEEGSEFRELICFFHEPIITDNIVFLGYQDSTICGLLNKSQSNYSKLQKYIESKNKRIREFKLFQQQANNSAGHEKILRLMFKEISQLHLFVVNEAEASVETNQLAQEKLESVARQAFKNKWYHPNKVGFVSLKDIEFLNLKDRK